MREKLSLFSPILGVLLCVAFQLCRSEDDKSMYNIHLKMELMEKKIDALQKREMHLIEITEFQQNAILELQTTVAKQQNTTNQHHETIQRHSEAIRHHDILMSSIRKQENQHKVVVATLKRTVMIQNRQIKRLSSQLASGEKKLETSIKVKSSIKSIPMKASGPIKSSHKQTDATPSYQPQGLPHKRLVLNYEGPIAFTTAVTKTTTNIGINQNIVFDHVILNLGNGYHNMHGIFIVPRNGLYVFSANLMIDNVGHGNAEAAIAHNGQDIVKLYTHGDGGSYAHTSQMVVLQANQGDEVWVRNIDFINTSVYGNMYSSFSGYLLYKF